MKPSTVTRILFPLAVVLVSCLADTTLPESVPGKLRDSASEDPPVLGTETDSKPLSRLGSLRATYTEKFCDLTREAVCATCNKIKICLVSTMDATKDMTNPKKDCPAASPYCSMTPLPGAVCQKTPDPNEAACIAAKITFTCPGVGFYPDPYSCQVYHYCSAQEATAQDYDCPDGYKFSSKTNACVPQAGKCPTVTCPPTQNMSSIYQAYPEDTMYYVFCSYDTTATPVKITPYILSCGTGSAYNPTTDQCEFKCTKEGYFVDTANPRQYYQCYLSNGKLIYKDKVCAVDKTFNTVANTCA